MLILTVEPAAAVAILGTKANWKAPDLKQAWLDHGTTKSGDGRGIPLNADAMTALEATRRQHPRFSGKCIQQSSTASGHGKAARRHRGLASWRVRSGTSLPELMELGG